MILCFYLVCEVCASINHNTYYVKNIGSIDQEKYKQNLFVWVDL